MSEEMGLSIFETIGAILVSALLFVLFVIQFTTTDKITTFLSPLLEFTAQIQALMAEKLVPLGLQVGVEAASGGLVPATEMFNENGEAEQ